MDRAQGRGPRQVAGGSDTFLAEARVPRGRCCKAVARSCIWGVGERPDLWPSAEAPTWRAVLRCLKYLFSKALTSR